MSTDLKSSSSVSSMFLVSSLPAEVNNFNPVNSSNGEGDDENRMMKEEEGEPIDGSLSPVGLLSSSEEEGSDGEFTPSIILLDERPSTPSTIVNAPPTTPPAGSSSDGMQTGDSMEGNGSHISISIGTTAEANKALIDMQKNYTTMQMNNYRNAVETLKSQLATQQAEMYATIAAGQADANSLYLDMGSNLGQAVTSGVNMGYNTVKSSKLTEDLAADQAKLKNAEAFEAEFQKASKAPSVFTDEDERVEAFKKLAPEEQERYRDITEGRGSLLYTAGDKSLLEHIASDPEASAKLTKHINQTKSDAITSQNTTVKQFESKLQTAGMGFQIAQQTMSAGMNAGKAVVALEKSHAQAAIDLAKASEGNLQATLSQNTQAAEGLASQSAQINQARVSLAGGGQG